MRKWGLRPGEATRWSEPQQHAQDELVLRQLAERRIALIPDAIETLVRRGELLRANDLLRTVDLRRWQGNVDPVWDDVSAELRPLLEVDPTGGQPSELLRVVHLLMWAEEHAAFAEDAPERAN